MKIRVLDLALSDLADGFRFYERQSIGLGGYFLDTLWSDIQSLNLYAGVHSQFRGYFRLLSKRFPFAVYYRINKSMIEVHAILDCRRSPSQAEKRLEVRERN